MKDPTTVYRWLVEVNSGYSTHTAFRGLADAADLALRTGRLAEAGPNVDSLVRYSQAFGDRFYQFEARLMFARLDYVTGQYQRSADGLEEAIELVQDHQPHKAIARWMQGCAYLQIQGGFEIGLAAWQRSLDEFHLLSLAPRLQPADWYRIRREEMRQAIQLVIDHHSLPDADGLTLAAPDSDVANRRSPFSMDGQRTDQQAPKAGSGELERPSLPVSQAVNGAGTVLPKRNLIIHTASRDDIQIRAGGPVPLKIEMDMLSGIEVDHLIINQQPYSIHAMPGYGPIPELKQDEILPFRVTGDSMNRAGILEGDYVLLHIQSEATHNDIVAAEIAGSDGEDEYNATLKRYQVYDEGRTIYFNSESDNPDHPERYFESVNQERPFRIIGVVIAVLKRMT
jgi:hypothetical protein